jgi:hypothetical protein
MEMEIKLFYSKVLYFIGDLISRTIMRLGDGYGYPIYNKIMLWSVNLDKHSRVWKKVKSKKRK